MRVSLDVTVTKLESKPFERQMNFGGGAVGRGAAFDLCWYRHGIVRYVPYLVVQEYITIVSAMILIASHPRYLP